MTIILREIGELNEIRCILVHHDRILLRIIDYLKQLRENDELNCHVEDRQLRLLFMGERDEAWLMHLDSS